MAPPTRRFVVFGFATTHDALAAEALLKHAGLDAVPIPAPRSVKALCGIAMRLPSEQATHAEKLMAAGGVRPSSRADSR